MERRIIIPQGLLPRTNYHPRLGEYNAGPLLPHDVPADLQPFRVQEYDATNRGPGGPNWNMRTALATEHIAKTTVLSRGLLGRNVTIGTEQTSLARAARLKGYLFLNPTASVGLTTTVVGLANSILLADGNTQASPIGVATFREIHVFVNLSDTDGGATTFTLFQQAQDPLSLEWTDVQMLLSTAVVGTYYVTPAAIGVATDLAFRWTLAGGTPTATVSISVVLKDGLAGSSISGLANIIYLGPNGVSTESGFPLLEGQSRSFYLRENLELYGIANATGLTLRVFEL